MPESQGYLKEVFSYVELKKQTEDQGGREVKIKQEEITEGEKP